MKLTAAISAITLAVSRLGTTAVSSVSHIQLVADLGYWILRINKLDPVGVSDGTGVLGEMFVDFFKTQTDDAALADAIATDFYKALRDDAGLTDAQIVDFFKALVDTTGAADHTALASAKPLADQVAILEDAVNAFYKVLTDEAGFSDNDVLAVFKALVDPSSVAEAHATEVGKNLADAGGFSDFTVRDFSKTLVDQITVTDDWDGAASILDDQNMQFYKQRTDIAAVSELFYRLVAYVRAFSDEASTSDSVASAVGKNTADAYTADDSVYAFDVHKPFQDLAGAYDAKAVAFSRGLSDTPAISDAAYAFDTTKPLYDGTSVAEAISLETAKAPFLEAASVSDYAAIVPQLVKTESTLLTDTGSLRSQGYCDFTYFAEDFVGASRTF